MAENTIKDVKMKIGTEAQFQEKLKDLPIGTLVGTTDPIDEGDLSTDIINKLAKADNALAKPTNDTTGTAGQVLMKASSGSVWGDVEKGTTVVANPGGGTEDLTSLTVGDKTYTIPSGGGSGDVTKAGNNDFTGVNSFNNMLYANGGVDTYQIENLNTIVTNGTTQGTLTIPKNVTGTLALTSDVTTATSGMVKETNSGITINNGQAAYKKAFTVSYTDPELGDYTGISYGIDRIVKSGISSYTYTFPNVEGEIVVKNSGGDVVGVGLSQAGTISQLNGATINTYGINVNNAADTMALSLTTDKIHTNNVDLTFPTKAGTFALTSDITSALTDYAKTSELPDMTNVVYKNINNTVISGTITFTNTSVFSNGVVAGNLATGTLYSKDKIINSDTGVTATLPTTTGTLALTSDITSALSGYAKTSDLSSYAKTSDLSNYLTSVPIASTATLGGIKIGECLTISSAGTLSLTNSNVTTALGYTPLSSSGGTISGHLRLKNSTNYGCRLSFGNGVFNSSQDSDYVYLYEDSDDHLTVYANKGIALKTGSSSTVTVNGTNIADLGGSSYTLPIASASTLGGVKIGVGIGIDVTDGTISLTKTGITSVLKYTPLDENDLVANPSSSASTTLSKIKIKGTTYSIPSGSSGGTTVSANPSGATTNSTTLNSITIGSTNYKLAIKEATFSNGTLTLTTW